MLGTTWGQQPAVLQHRIAQHVNHVSCNHGSAPLAIRQHSRRPHGNAARVGCQHQGRDCFHSPLCFCCCHIPWLLRMAILPGDKGRQCACRGQRHKTAGDDMAEATLGMWTRSGQPSSGTSPKQPLHFEPEPQIHTTVELLFRALDPHRQLSSLYLAVPFATMLKAYL